MNAQINETIENTTQAGRVAADRFQSAFGDVNERAKTTMEKSAKIMEEMTELTRGNVEALVASSKVAARGVETMTQEVADFSRRSFEEASSTMKSFTEVKSPTDLFRLQSDFARAQFDAMVAESSKMSEAMIKLAGEVAQPITSRYSVAADRVKTLAL
jgi:phasin family protein